MSNFLQRVAASVVPIADGSRDHTRLQPTLGSVFMQAELRTPLYGNPTPTTLPGATEELTSGSAEAHPLFPGSARATDSVPISLQDVHEQGRESTTAFGIDRQETLLPLGDYVKSLVRSSLGDFRASQVPDSTLSLQAPENASSQTDVIAAHTQTPRPQVTEVSRTQLNPIQPVIAPSPVGSKLRAPVAPRSTGTATRTPHNQGDEVHIHIGRIEVAAITPPVTRQAPQERRKSMSLDEYLRRSGNGGRG